MRVKNCLPCLLSTLVFTLCLTVAVDARALFDTPPGGNAGISPKVMLGTPNAQYDQHNVGKMALLITNYGTFGGGYVTSPIINGEEALGCEYPINSQMEYLFAGALWVGAIVGRDTLVSVGGDGWFGTQELYPDADDAGAIIARSSLKSKSTYSPDAVSEQDFLCTYFDTNTTMPANDPIDNRPHIPLNISIQQNSYSWSYDYAEDFVLFDFKISNIGAFPIKQLYAALYVDADVYHNSVGNNGAQDDICGFRRTAAMPADYCITEDTINIAWIADNDGDPTNDGNWSFTSPVAVTGSRVLRSPNKDLQYSFNWWISNTTATFDFGPRMAGTNEKPFRSFGAHMGTPTGDKNKYYTMSDGEFDYDQLFTAMTHTSEGYLPPPKQDLATDLANGYDTRYLLSFGPFDVQPGDTLPITIAYVAGDNFHVNAMDFLDYFDAYNPSLYYNKLDFSDLGTNARWASWIFDNPGVDTDTTDSYGVLYPEGEDDSGKFCWSYGGLIDTSIWIPDISTPEPDDSILVDTTFVKDSTKMYYAGDGVPDFRGASPPPPPTIHVTPGFGQVTIRWNGQESENAYDVFARQKDFEGFRVYYAQGDRMQDYVLLASFDLDDYKVYQYDNILQLWEQTGVPLTLDSLRTLYGPDFQPLSYNSEFNYFVDPSTSEWLYFKAQDWNQSDLTDPMGIHKVYPTASRTDLADTTSEGFLRYYEYEYVIPNLLPSIPYNFSVTAFDFGSLKTDMGALESSPLTNAVKEYPLPSADQVQSEGLGVIVYPNPYRIDAGYADAGFENRDRDRAAERSRAIHFANLPRVCTIRIYTISGDLVRELNHYYPDGGPQSQHEEWDVISRNTQAVVTGLYLYQIESEFGNQVGKLVIIK